MATELLDDPQQQVIEDIVTQAVTQTIKETKTKSDDHGWFWTVAVKMVLVMWVIFITCFLPWAIWVTSSIYQSESHIDNSELFIQRFDKVDIEIKSINDNIKTIPLRVDVLEQSQQDLSKAYIKSEERSVEIDKKNSSEHSDIKIMLSGLKTKMDIMVPESNDGG